MILRRCSVDQAFHIKRIILNCTKGTRQRQLDYRASHAVLDLGVQGATASWTPTQLKDQWTIYEFARQVLSPGPAKTSLTRQQMHGGPSFMIFQMTVVRQVFFSV